MSMPNANNANNAKSGLLDLAVLERKKYNYLDEIRDLTEQLGQALDRSDEVSVRVLLAMREEPLLHLREVQQMVRDRRASLSPEEQSRVKALLSGESPDTKEETMLRNQAGQARRLLERVVEMDKRLSIRMAGDESFYKKTQAK